MCATYNPTMASTPTRLAIALSCLAAALSTPPAWAEATPAKPAAPVLTPTPPAGEPVVQYIVLEDESTRIEELHVRGEAQRITVQPKGLSKRFGYEILPASGARDLAPGPGSTRGAAGQRVWHILNF
jgi:hypothetical protein